jgi:hypothetical protein
MQAVETTPARPRQEIANIQHKRPIDQRESVMAAVSGVRACSPADTTTMVGGSGEQASAARTRLTICQTNAPMQTVGRTPARPRQEIANIQHKRPTKERDSVMAAVSGVGACSTSDAARMGGGRREQASATPTQAILFQPRSIESIGHSDRHTARYLDCQHETHTATSQKSVCQTF